LMVAILDASGQREIDPPRPIRAANSTGKRVGGQEQTGEDGEGTGDRGQASGDKERHDQDPAWA